jgi:hypothetical protein
MKWEYQVVAATDLGDFVSRLNRLGEDGWEAISGTYTLGEPETRMMGVGTAEFPGSPQWVAVMKRPKAN